MTLTTTNAQDLSFDLRSDYEYITLTKTPNIYSPDSPLPRDENGNPIPEADVPHTEIGSRGGKYSQAREFDAQGNPVKDIDFTDHGRPKTHPNPHEHPYQPNPTGGTPKRGNPQPLENWKY